MKLEEQGRVTSTACIPPSPLTTLTLKHASRVYLSHIPVFLFLSRLFPYTSDLHTPWEVTRPANTTRPFVRRGARRPLSPSPSPLC